MCAVPLELCSLFILAHGLKSMVTTSIEPLALFIGIFMIYTSTI